VREFSVSTYAPEKITINGPYPGSNFLLNKVFPAGMAEMDHAVS